MDKLVIDAFTPVITDLTERIKQLLDRVVDQVEIDWFTGRVNIRDVDSIVMAYQDTIGPDSEILARHFVALLRDGFAVLDRGAGAGSPPFGIPWRALFYARTVSEMPIDHWKALGIGPWSSTDSIKETFAQKFTNVPDYVLEEGRLNDLVEWATRRSVLDHLDQELMIPMGGRREVDPDIPEGNPDEPPPRVDPEIAQKILELAQKAANCLVNSPWSWEWKGWFPVGVRVCLDKECADILQTALLGTASPQLIKIFFAAISAKSVSAVLKAAGGWVGLALLHFSLHWGLMIALNKTANGVCLIHFFPWLSAAFGGIINGYGEGR